jgi:hypothetical protein
MMAPGDCGVGPASGCKLSLSVAPAVCVVVFGGHARLGNVGGQPGDCGVGPASGCKLSLSVAPDVCGGGVWLDVYQEALSRENRGQQVCQLAGGLRHSSHTPGPCSLPVDTVG